MTRERDEFMALLAKEMPETPSHLVVDFARKIMRQAKTHGRLAEAHCNGDWPADNGERKTELCKGCECGWVPSTISKKTGLCKSCRIEVAIAKECEPFSIKADFQGDPRGCTVKLVVPSGKTNDWGKTGICVPQ